MSGIGKYGHRLLPCEYSPCIDAPQGFSRIRRSPGAGRGRMWRWPGGEQCRRRCPPPWVRLPSWPRPAWRLSSAPASTSGPARPRPAVPAAGASPPHRRSPAASAVSSRWRRRLLVPPRRAVDRRARPRRRCCRSCRSLRPRRHRPRRHRPRRHPPRPHCQVRRRRPAVPRRLPALRRFPRGCTRPAGSRSTCVACCRRSARCVRRPLTRPVEPHRRRHMRVRHYVTPPIRTAARRTAGEVTRARADHATATTTRSAIGATTVATACAAGPVTMVVMVAITPATTAEQAAGLDRRPPGLRPLTSVRATASAPSIRHRGSPEGSFRAPAIPAH
jgi:hypothetical protein